MVSTRESRYLRVESSRAGPPARRLGHGAYADGVTIDWTNPTIQGVLVGGAIGLAGVLAAAVAGYLGARGGARIAAAASSEEARLAQVEAQADRQAALEARSIERQDARRDRFADRKLSLAVELLLAADLHADEARTNVAARFDRWRDEDEYGPEAFDGVPTNFPSIGTTTPVRAAWQSLDLVAPNVESQARALYEATVPLGSLAADWSEPGSGDPAGRWPIDWTTANDRWNEARHAFVAAVRADLNVNP